MAKYFSDGRTPVGVVYEEDERFHYECEFCSYSVSSNREYRVVQKADDHEQLECTMRTNDRI